MNLTHVCLDASSSVSDQEPVRETENRHPSAMSCGKDGWNDDKQFMDMLVLSTE